MYLNIMDADDSIDSQESSRPVVHSPGDAIVCAECQRLDADAALFDPLCVGCQKLLHDELTSVPQLFAVLRQWTPKTQQHAAMIIRQMLKVGLHVNDRDGLTDMTVLHYACKSGARGVGNGDTACELVRFLLSLDADPYIRCRWTNMTAIHYAAFFDVASVIEVLLHTTKGIDIDSPCSEFENGTPLHIAARNLAVESVSMLLLHGAHPHIKDSLGKMPIDWVPDSSSFESNSESALLSSELRKMLLEAQPSADSFQPLDNGVAHDLQVAEALQAIGVNIGDRVVVGSAKTGVLRYCGKTLFAGGLWAGIELDEAAGKNNGTIDSIPYFHCPPNYGIFAPLGKISLPGSLMAAASRSSLQRLNVGKVEVGHITAKVDTGLKQSRSSTSSAEIQIGDKVLVAGKRTGIVRFIGATDFATGIWFGIELSKAVGKNDGSVNGKRYFSCAPEHGVFAPPSRVQLMFEGVASPASVPNSVSASSVNTPLRSTGTGFATQQHDNHSLEKYKLKSQRSGAIIRGPMSTLHSTTNVTGNGEMKLKEGVTVFCSGEMGVIRYVGPVDFADGVWLGVELKTARGKHDGSVQGRRYFTCTPGYGLLVRPARVSVRGISGTNLRLE